MALVQRLEAATGRVALLVKYVKPKLQGLALARVSVSERSCGMLHSGIMWRQSRLPSGNISV